MSTEPPRHHKTDGYTKIQEIAKYGLGLFGEGEMSQGQKNALLYSPKHSKTKTFRTALDSYLRAKSKGWSGEEVDEFLRGQVSATAKRERYAGYVSSDAVKRFTNAIRDYLEEQDLDDVKTLSDWQNELTNTYLYVIEDILEGNNNDN